MNKITFVLLVAGLFLGAGCSRPSEEASAKPSPTPRVQVTKGTTVQPVAETSPATGASPSQTP